MTDVDLSTGRSEVRMVPDNYQGLLSFSAWYELRSEGEDQCCQHFEGDLRVRLPLLGPLAERAIGGSIRQNIADTARLVERYVSEPTAAPTGRPGTADPARCRLTTPMTPTPDALDAVLGRRTGGWPGQAAAGVVARPSPTGSPEVVAASGPVDEAFEWASVTKLLVSLGQHGRRRRRHGQLRGPSRPTRLHPVPPAGSRLRFAL